MALLHYANKNLDHSKFYVITIHHNLRGKEGERDRDFVKDYCSKNNIECEVYEEQIKPFCEENGYTIEQGARIRRRQIFKEIVDSKKADRVVTAHQKDDQIESILMHIFRGSGIKGLCGMQEDDGIILRPMLNVSSEEIRDYLKNNNIEYVQDSTNFELNYSRNRVRQIVLKDIQDVYPNAGDNILRLSDIANDVQSMIEKKAPDYEKVIDGVYLKTSDLLAKDVIATQGIINAVDAVSTRVDLERRHVDSIFALIDKENGKIVELPFNTLAIKEYDKILFTKNKQTNIDPVLLTYGTYILGDWKISISDRENGGLRLDMDKAKGAYIQARKQGMKFKRFKGGTKSLGDYLTDIKVPKRIRDYLPIIAKNDDVYAVLPYEISDFVAVDEQTKNVAYIKTVRI